MRQDLRMEVTALDTMIQRADNLSTIINDVDNPVIYNDHNPVIHNDPDIKNTAKVPATILLCADNNAVKEYARMHYPDRVYTSQSLPLHTDISGKTDHESLLTGTIETWVDVLMMALQDGIVISSSGFSVLAAQVGNYQPHQILTGSV